MSYAWSRNSHRRDNNEEELRYLLNTYGVDSYPILGQSGEPDLLCSTAGGLVFMLEVKSRYGKLTKGQEQWMSAFNGPAYVIRDSSEIEGILSEVVEHYRNALGPF